MPIEALRLQNFMAFADTGWIELRKINLLLGRNSSGKSAIIRALRLMKQSLLANDSGQSLVFVAEDGVDLGSFDEAVHKAAGKEVQPQEVPESEPDDIHRSDPITFGFRGSFASESAITSERLLWPAWIKHLGLPAETTADSLLFEINISYRQDNVSKEVTTYVSRPDSMVGMDVDNIILDEYERNLSRSNGYRKWLTRLWEKQRVHWCTGRLPNHHSSTLGRYGCHEPTDQTFVGVAYNSDRVLISEDSDVGKGPKGGDPPHCYAGEYLANDMGIQVYSAQEACDSCWS